MTFERYNQSVQPQCTALFKSVLEIILRENRIRAGGTIYNSTSQIFAYVGTTSPTLRTTRAQVKMFRQFEIKAQEMAYARIKISKIP